MDFILLIIFLGTHYLRPQEWESLSWLRPAQVLAALAVVALFMREKTVRLRDLVSTPQDWLVTAYFGWTVFASPTPVSTFRAILPLMLFYYLGVLALNSIAKLQKFIWWWGMFIVGVAALALLSKVGFDPFDSLRITEGIMKGRLVLNLSIFNNPNSLGHAIVPAIPLLYYALFWRKLFSKVLIGLLAIPLFCIYFTVSKGAFIAGAFTLLATLTIGRPRSVQIGLIAVSLMFGGTLLYALPRMNELTAEKGDDAIQGRVAAFSFGLNQMKTKTYGHGLGNFMPEFYAHGPTQKVKIVGSVGGKSVVRYVQQHYYKAPHSAYNQNGADLGYTGLFLFVGILYTCVRSLLAMRTENTGEEMVRRALFGFVVSFAISSWMVDFCYRATFFLMAAAVSALHRHFMQQPQEGEAAVDPAPGMPWNRTPEYAPVALPTALQPGTLETVSLAPATGFAAALRQPPADDPEDDEDAEGRGVLNWTRYGWLDLVFTYLCTAAVIEVWKYAIRHM